MEATFIKATGGIKRGESLIFKLWFGNAANTMAFRKLGKRMQKGEISNCDPPSN